MHRPIDRSIPAFSGARARHATVPVHGRSSRRLAKLKCSPKRVVLWRSPERRRRSSLLCASILRTYPAHPSINPPTGRPIGQPVIDALQYEDRPRPPPPAPVPATHHTRGGGRGQRRPRPRAAPAATLGEFLAGGEPTLPPREPTGRPAGGRGPGRGRSHPPPAPAAGKGNGR